MLHFFRKYQRFFFAIITVVIAFSFVFFGTHSAVNSVEQKPDRKVGTTLTGKRMMSSDIEAMSHFLSTDSTDKLSQSRPPNLLNDGVLSIDFLKTGIANLLVQKYFTQLEPELQNRFERSKNYRPYSHPDAAFIKASQIWEAFLPQMNQDLEQLNKETQVSPAFFQSLVDLYLDQAQFSPDMLKRTLYYQQSQYSWITPDPNLSHSDLSLFGFHSLTDWFSNDFVDLVSQFVINMAAIAEKKGYMVSDQEAKCDLIHNVEKGYHTQTKTLNLSPTSAGEIFEQQLKWIGMSEKQVVKVWKQVLLFRRLFADVANSAFIDSLPYEDFVSFAFDSATLDLYDLPAHLQLEHFSDLCQFQFYLTAVASTTTEPLALPETFYTPEQVERTYPELVEKKYQLEISHVKKENIALRIGVKKMWDWQLKEANWETLQKEFAELRSQNAYTASDRFQILESLDPRLRYKIDQFSREAIVDKHPDWIAEELKFAASKEEVIGIRSKMTHFPLEGIQRPQRLIGLIERASLKGEPQESSELLSYSDDEKNYYLIEVLKKSPQKEILSFAQAKETEALTPLMNRFLEEKYHALREEHPTTFQNENGDWRSFTSVKETVARYVFTDVLQAIDYDHQTYKGNISWTPGWGPYAFYPSKRLLPHMREVKAGLKHGKKSAEFVREERDVELFEVAIPLIDQWKINSTQKAITRSDKTEWCSNQAFDLNLGSWSHIQNEESGQILFYHLLKRDGGEESILEEVSVGKKILANDAKRYLTRHWLEQLQKAEAIQIPVNDL